MRRIIQIIVVLLLGILIGVFVYARYFQQNNVPSEHEDSLLVSNLYGHAQDNINKEIAESRQNAITRAVQEISPAVVSVTVIQVRERIIRSPFITRDPWLREFFPELFQDKRLQEQFESLGSGFLISEDGYILTNEHVVHNATKIMITMVGGDKADAEIVGSDFISDIALLKVNKADMPFIKLGDSDHVLLGEWTIAVGNPFGLFEISNYPTVTVGVVSAINRDFGTVGNSGRVYNDMIQTDASINHGNSGGPLCNALGEAIGMNTFIYTGSQLSEGSVGIGFAIPINHIKRIIDDLKRFQRVDRDIWIGIRVKDLTGLIAKQLGYPSTSGAMISHIELGSPAEKAGIQLGDIIVGMDDETVVNSDHLSALIDGKDLKVGDTLTFKIWREGKEIEVTLNLISRR
jgi:serine protease Do